MPPGRRAVSAAAPAVAAFREAQNGRVLTRVLLLLVLVCSCLPAWAIPNHGVLVVVANRLALRDIESDPILRTLARTAAVGLVCPSSAGYRTPESVHASASAGAYSRGAYQFGLVFNAAEPYEDGTAAEAYARRTGYPWPDSGLVQVGLAAVAAANRRLPSPPVVGALGDALERAGVNRAAFGNSDSSEYPTRMGAALMADSRGRIPRGDVGPETNLTDPSVPGGRSTDVAGLIPLALEQTRDNAVVLVEFGDLQRIEKERPACTQLAYDSARREAVSRLGIWLQEMRARSPRTPILLLSPVPPYSETDRWDTPGLAAVWTQGGASGLLRSNTTRTPGLIAAIDIGPSILSLAGVRKPHEMIGYSAGRNADPDPFPTLRRWNEIIALNHALQFPIILGLGLVAGLSGLAGTGYLLSRNPSRRTAVGAVVALAITAWIPAILLLPLDRPAWLALLPVAVVVSFAAAARIGANGRFLPIEVPAGVLLAGVALSSAGLVDLIARSPLCSWQLSGLRYYGIGNEFLGCAIGAASVVPLWRYGKSDARPPLAPLAAWFAVWVLVIGLPSLGANSGGAIAATATFGLILRAIAGHRIRLKDVCVLALAGIAVAVVFAMFDALLSGGAPSHMGQAARALRSDGPGYLAALVQRKLLMNLSVWRQPEARIAMVIFGILIAAWAVFRDRMLQRAKLEPRIVQGLIGLAAGGVVAVIFNDSGPVTLAFIASYAFMWWLWDGVTRRAGGLPGLRRHNAHSGR